MINKSSLKNLDQNKADNLLTNLGDNISNANNRLISGDFSNAVNDLNELQSEYNELITAINNNNLYDVLSSKIDIITNSINSLKEQTNQFLHTQEQSISKMLESLPQVASKFREIEQQIHNVNNELNNQSSIQQFTNQIDNLKNKLNELIKLPLIDRSQVQQCATDMAKIYVETIDDAMKMANFGKGLISQAIKEDKFEIANELKNILSETTLALNIMPNIGNNNLQNLNNTTNEAINIVKINSLVDKIESILNSSSGNGNDLNQLTSMIRELIGTLNNGGFDVKEISNELSNIINGYNTLISGIGTIKTEYIELNKLMSDFAEKNNIAFNNNLFNSDKLKEYEANLENIKNKVEEIYSQPLINDEKTKQSMDKLHEIFSKFNPMDFESILKYSNEAQEGLRNQIFSMMSGSGSNQDIQVINKLLNSYKSISGSAYNSINSQNNVKDLTQNFLDEYNGNYDQNVMDNIIDNIKSELANLIISANDITRKIASGNTSRSLLTDPIYNGLNNGLGYYNSQILRQLSGPYNEYLIGNNFGGFYSQMSSGFGGNSGFNGGNGGNGGFNNGGYFLGPGLPPDGSYHRKKMENIEDMIKYSEQFGNEYGITGSTIKNARKSAEDIARGIKSKKYNSFDINRMKMFGYDEDYFDQLASSLGGIENDIRSKDETASNLGKQFAEYKRAYGEFEKDPTEDKLKDLDDKAKDISKTIEDLRKIMESIANGFRDERLYGAFDNFRFRKIDGTIGSEYNNIKDILRESLDSNNDAGDSLKRAAEAFGQNIEISSVDFKDKISSAAKEITTATASGFSSLKKSLTKITGTINKLTGVNLGLMNIYSGSVDYYKRFGQMDIDSTKALMQRGDYFSQDLLDLNRDQTKYLYAKYNGQINFGEYSSMLNGLISSVQGHTGDKNKISGINDMINLSETAILLNKVYDVDSTSAIKTFYKDLGKNADEAENYLYKLVQTAQSSNIPVSQYVKTIENMAKQFKELGVNIDLANIGMGNLMLMGMTFEDSQSFMGDYSSAVGNFGQNAGESAFYGALIGQNPWDATWSSVNLWEQDSNGNWITSESATQNLMSMLDAKIGLYDQIGGGTSYGNRILYDMFKDMGFSNKNAAIATNLYRQGDSQGLSQLLSNNEEEDNTVKLEGKAELEEKLSLVASQTDALTTAQNQLNLTQMNLANVGKGLLDMVGNGLMSVIASVGGILIKAIDVLASVGNVVANFANKIGLGIDNPFKTIATAASILVGGKGILSYTTNGLLGGSTGKIASNAMVGLNAGSKLAKVGVPVVSGVIDGTVTGLDSYYVQGKTKGYAIGEGVGSGVGAGLGTWGGAAAGAAIGTAIFPGVGTVIGGTIGAIAGGYGGGAVGKKVSQIGMDAFGVQEYREGTQPMSGYLNDGSLYPYNNNYQAAFYNETGIDEFKLDYTDLINANDNSAKSISNAEMEQQQLLYDEQNDILKSGLNKLDGIEKNLYKETISSSGSTTIINSATGKTLYDSNNIENMYSNGDALSKSMQGYTLHKSKSGTTHGGGGGSFGHGGGGGSFDHGGGGGSFEDSSKKSWWNTFLNFVVDSANIMAMIGGTQIYTNSKKAEEKLETKKVLEEQKLQNEKTAQEAYDQELLAIQQQEKYFSELINQADSEYSLLKLISNIDNKILSKMSTIITGINNLSNGSIGSGSSSGTTTTHISSSDTTHGGGGGSFGSSNSVFVEDSANVSKNVKLGTNTIVFSGFKNEQTGPNGVRLSDKQIVDSILNQLGGEIDQSDFKSDNRGKYYLKGSSKDSDPRFTLEEIKNIIKMSSNNDYTWLTGGKIYDPTKTSSSNTPSTPVNAESSSINTVTSSNSSAVTSSNSSGGVFNNYNGSSYAPIYKIGSAEYSHQTTQYNPDAFVGYDPLNMQITSAQGFARKLATNPESFSSDMSLLAGEATMSAIQSSSMSAIASKYGLDLSSNYNNDTSTRTGTKQNARTTNQNFEININIENNDKAYAEAVQVAIEQVTKEFYDTTDMVSDIQYNIINN